MMMLVLLFVGLVNACTFTLDPAGVDASNSTRLATLQYAVDLFDNSTVGHANQTLDVCFASGTYDSMDVEVPQNASFNNLILRGLGNVTLNPVDIFANFSLSVAFSGFTLSEAYVEVFGSISMSDIHFQVVNVKGLVALEGREISLASISSSANMTFHLSYNGVAGAPSLVTVSSARLVDSRLRVRSTEFGKVWLERVTAERGSVDVGFGYATAPNDYNRATIVDCSFTDIEFLMRPSKTLFSYLRIQNSTLVGFSDAWVTMSSVQIDNSTISDFYDVMFNTKLTSLTDVALSNCSSKFTSLALFSGDRITLTRIAVTCTPGSANTTLWDCNAFGFACLNVTDSTKSGCPPVSCSYDEVPTSNGFACVPCPAPLVKEGDECVPCPDDSIYDSGYCRFVFPDPDHRCYNKVWNNVTMQCESCPKGLFPFENECVKQPACDGRRQFYSELDAACKTCDSDEMWNYEVGYCSLCPYGRVANDNSTDCNGCADGFYPSEVVDVEYDCLPCGPLAFGPAFRGVCSISTILPVTIPAVIMFLFFCCGCIFVTCLYTRQKKRQAKAQYEPLLQSMGE